MNHKIIIATIASGFAALTTASTMDLGTNLWNLRWHAPDDCFTDVKAVTSDNPWNPLFLDDLKPYQSIRFMDWDYINGSTRTKWSERTHKEDPAQQTAAYEWMIDLCNRTQSDLWLCLPHLTVTRDTGDKPCDYALRLSILVKTGVDVEEIDLAPLESKLSTMTPEDFIKAGGKKTCEPLSPSLRFYIEYSNETWNGGFKQSHYCVEEGTALDLAPTATPGGDGKNWTAGCRFRPWAGLRVFRAADLVFGEDSKQLEKVFAMQNGSAFQLDQHLAVMRDSKLNPWATKATAIATAPYFGHKISGKSENVIEETRASIAEKITQSAALSVSTRAAGLKMIAYEGGQHFTQDANIPNKMPEMADLYKEYLEGMSAHFSHFSHYALTGRCGPKGAWGSKEKTGQPLEDAPKARALTEFTAKNPRQPLK